MVSYYHPHFVDEPTRAQRGVSCRHRHVQPAPLAVVGRLLAPHQTTLTLWPSRLVSASPSLDIRVPLFLSSLSFRISKLPLCIHHHVSYTVHSHSTAVEPLQEEESSQCSRHDREEGRPGPCSHRTCFPVGETLKIHTAHAG